MIKQSTVLVLGAGASEPYGFPIGSALVDQVCSEIIDINALTQRLVAFNVIPVEAVKFAHSLRDARPYSIDAFLEMRKEYRQIGKLAIADILLRAEDQRRLDTAPISHDWYRYLLNKLVLRSPDYYSAQAKKLTIVTFNFDRSFERALFSRLKAAFGLTAAKARQLATELSIHHIHGVLGKASWLDPGSRDATHYGGVEPGGSIETGQQFQFRKSVKKAVRRIKIVDEEIDQAVVEDVFAALQDAVYVYFIGFGFDERNVAKLSIPRSLLSQSPTRSPPTVRATCFKWPAAEIPAIVRCCSPQPVHVHSVDAISFMRAHAEALFE